MMKRRPVFRSFRLPITLFLALAAFLAAAPPGWASGDSQTVERKLRVKAESAPVRLAADAASPAVAALKRGTVVMSYEAEGAWYRIVPELGKEAISLVGYIAAADVEVLEEKVKVSGDFWSGSEAASRTGLEITLAGGYVLFGGGDLDAGTRGLYDELRARMIGLGYTISRDYRHALNGGMELEAAVLWRFHPRWAAGLIGEYSLAQRFNEFEFQEGSHTLGASSTPILRTFAVRPVLRCGILAGGPIELLLSAGPALFFSSFQYNQNVSYAFVADQGTTRDESYSIKARRTFWGAFAALDLDVRLNARSAIVLQATYRFARPAGWEGTEKAYEWITNVHEVNGPEIQGRLYSTTRNSLPVLVVSPQSPGAGAGEAVLDLTGLSLHAGLRIRF